jgi:diguanylate cyclase (GGDEF)-like protein
MHWKTKENHSTNAELELPHALLALAQQLQSSLDLDEVVRVIATAASDTFGYAETSVLVREKGDVLRMRAIVGDLSSLVHAPIPLTSFEELVTGKHRVGPGILVEGNDSAWTRTGLEVLAARSSKGRWSRDDGDTLFIPFIDNAGELTGVLRLGAPRDETLKPQTLTPLEIFAAHAAAALANAREHQQLREVSDELAMQLRIRRDVSEMTNMLLSDLDPQAVFEKSARALAKLVPFDAFGIGLPNDDPGAEGAFEAVFTAPDPANEGFLGVLVGEDGLAQSVLDTGQTRVAGFGEPEGPRFDGACEEVGEIILAPLKVGGKSSGVIAVGRRRSRVFTERERELVQLFVNIATIAVHNARMYQEVEHLAISDGLTGVHNYRHFREALASEVSRADRYSETFCLLMMDLDHFKAVNDTVGHQQGDEVLKAVTNVLRQCSRESDYLARYGGEEFVMILPRTPLREARIVAERIRRKVREIDPGSPALKVSMSIGVAAYPDDSPDMDAVLRSADAALLRAKSSGRNRVYLHGEVDDGIGIIDERWASLARRFSATARLSEAESAGLVGALAATALISRPTGAAGIAGADARALPRAPWLAADSDPGSLASVALLYSTERWDGTGYPEGLTGDEIPKVARAYSVCRDYLQVERQEPGAALRTLRARAGTELDPRLVHRLSQALAEPDGLARAGTR